MAYTYRASRGNQLGSNTQEDDRERGYGQRKRQREEEEADGARPYPISRGDTITQNKNQLRILDCAGSPGLLRLRAPDGAQDMALYTAAAKAARMRDLQAGPTLSRRRANTRR